MTTLLLPPDEIAKLRVLKGLAYMIAVMVTLDRHYPGHAFRPEQIALVAGMDVRTASKQLQDLSTLDRVILTKGGYVLTQGGRALFLAPATDEALALSPENSQALEAQALDDVSDVQNFKDAQDNTHAACALLKKKEEVDSFSNLKPESTSTTSESAQTLRTDGKWPTVKEILEATPDLFGEPGVLLHGLNFETITPWMALAWIAHCWDQWPKGGGNGNLHTPAGVAYKHLRNGDKPRPIYYNSGWEILPDQFMESLGLRNYPCECGQVFGKRTEFDQHVQMLFCCEELGNGCEKRFHSLETMEEHVEKEHAKAKQQMRKPLDDGHAGSSAWRGVLEALQMEMPRASFDTWVRDTQPIEYDGKVLTVGVRNAYCRDWLESRLESIVQNLLIGILNAKITVRFVVATIGEEVIDD